MREIIFSILLSRSFITPFVEILKSNYFGSWVCSSHGNGVGLWASGGKSITVFVLLTWRPVYFSKVLRWVKMGSRERREAMHSKTSSQCRAMDRLRPWEMTGGIFGSDLIKMARSSIVRINMNPAMGSPCLTPHSSRSGAEGCPLMRICEVDSERR
eukprot:TRINITY_DN6461_c0_g1_i8.p2 TRINITY_DN6461_c0_g1~~TRINITY_DN6461_c0_g1_i8.p2  ORF type:complete len:156 (-),score=12.81 TRINITY_DN6461_c0_g1_i8:1790-2257(-)